VLTRAGSASFAAAPHALTALDAACFTYAPTSSSVCSSASTTTEQFDGTGIGLALVRRIVVRHAGTTSAEGKLYEGATFAFTLPRSSTLT